MIEDPGLNSNPSPAPYEGYWVQCKSCGCDYDYNVHDFDECPDCIKRHDDD